MKRAKQSLSATLVSALWVVLTSAWGPTASAREVTAALLGKDEVPPVTTKAKGAVSFNIEDDGTISGTVTTTDMNAMMAHIHEAPPGKNGPVIVELEKSGDHTFKVPAGTKLTEAQMKAFKEGHLYVNVHSAQHKNGEIRGQL